MNNETLEKCINKINELVTDGDKNLYKGLGEVAPDMADYVF